MMTLVFRPLFLVFSFRREDCPRDGRTVSIQIRCESHDGVLLVDGPTENHGSRPAVRLRTGRYRFYRISRKLTKFAFDVFVADNVEQSDVQARRPVAYPTLMAAPDRVQQTRVRPHAKQADVQIFLKRFEKSNLRAHESLELGCSL